MLFIAQKPSQVLITPSKKLIIGTATQLFFSTVDFVEQYLSILLPSMNPEILQYSQQSGETVVATCSSLQLYWTDWHQRVQLRLYLPLNQEPVYSLHYFNNWQVFGQFQQYSTKQVKLYSIDNPCEGQDYPNCFLGPQQFLINRKHLIVVNHFTKQRTNIQWEEADIFLPVFSKKKIKMKAVALSPQVTLIQAGNVLLYIQKEAVCKTIDHEGDLIVTDKVAVWMHLGKMTIYSMTDGLINSHGTYQAYDGHYYGATLHQNTLRLLFYDFQELRIRSLPLSQEPMISSFQPQKPIEKPFEDKDRKEMQLHESTQSLQGQGLQKALKLSIGKFKEEFDKSMEEQKYSQGRALVRQLTLQGTDPAYYQVRQKEQENRFRIQTFAMLQPLRQSGLHFEQPSQLSEVSLPPNPGSLSGFEGVETPAFEFNDTPPNSDRWGQPDNLWNLKPDVIKQIQIIEEEGDQLQSQQISPLVTNVLPPTQHLNSQCLGYFQQNDDPDLSSERPSTNKLFKGPLATDRNTIKDSLQLFNPCPKVQANSSQSFSKSARRKRVLSSEVFDGETPMIRIPSGQILNFNAAPSALLNQTTNQQTQQNQEISQTVFSSQLHKKKRPNKTKNSQIRVKSTSKEHLQTGWETKSKVLKPVVFPQNKKYTQVLTQLYRKQPESFDEELYKAMPWVIKEKQARLFFAEHIRNFNSDLTKDQLLRLYRSVEDTLQNRQLMSKALSEFKLNQVPSICLHFEHDFVETFRLINPNVYIQDLLEPSIRVIEDLVHNYFNKQFQKTFVSIQNLKISLEYPRNLLNVLLYINQVFKLPNDAIFSVYSKQMYKNNHCKTMLKIIESNIPSVCQVDEQVFEQAAQKAVCELLEDNITDFTLLDQIIGFLSNKNKKEYDNMISLAEELSVSGLMFSTKSLLELHSISSNSRFFKDVINMNSASSLAKVNFSVLLQLAKKVKQEKNQNIYTLQDIQVTKLLAEKHLSNKRLTDGLVCLAPLSPGLSKAYLAALLIKHNQGHYANRLSQVNIFAPSDFSALFPQITSGSKRLKRGDPIPTDVQNKMAILSWEEFNKLCQQIAPENCWELNYLIYTDIELACQLVQEQVLTSSKLDECCKHLGYFWNFHKKQSLQIEKPRKMPLKFGSDSIRSNESADIYLSVRQRKKTKIKLRRSLKENQEQNKNRLFLSKSFFQSENDTDPILYDIKFSVQASQSIRILKDYYQQSPIEQFFQAVKLVDQQKIGMRQKNVSNFKALYNLQLEYPYKQMVPFEYFFDKNDAWNKIKEELNMELNVNNFWMLHILVTILYDKPAQTVSMLINKIILYFKNDNWAAAIEDCLKQFKLPEDFLKTAAQDAAHRGLVSIQTVLQKYLE